jgi:hypothetical protein
MRNLIATFVGVLALAFVSSCGGSGGGTCSNSAACGGNIVGTWKITSSCVTASEQMFDMSCPGASVSSTNLTVTGSVTYMADLTYTSNFTSSGSVTVTLPASCLMSQGITVTCDQLNQIFASDPTTPPGTHCSNAGSGCACTVVEMNQTSTDTGTYTTTPAGLLTETAAGGTPDQSDYCVKDTTLTVSPHAGSSMMGAGISGTITLSKQ